MIEFLIACLIVVAIYLVVHLVVTNLGWPAWVLQAVGIILGLFILIAAIRLAVPWLGAIAR